MENWDEDQLRDVVNKKHGEQEKSLPKTAIVSTRQSFTFVQQYE